MSENRHQHRHQNRSMLLLAMLAGLAPFAVACSSSGDAPQDVLDVDSDDTPATDSVSDSAPADGTPVNTAPPPCGTDGWTTYAHDARRTSATDACVPGALTTVFRYAPTPASGKTLKRVFNVIAQTDGAFVQWSQSNASYLGTTSLDRISLDGTMKWNWDSGTDTNLGHWPILAYGQVIVNDDGVYFVDPATGKAGPNTGVDWWGEMATDGTRLYLANRAHIDGPGLLVSALDKDGKVIWKANEYGVCRIDAVDLGDGVAIDSGKLFYAPMYMGGTGVTIPFQSGLDALDPAKGTVMWSQVGKPSSMISAGSGMVYLVEDGKQLVARSQSDGAVKWSHPLTSPGAQAPALASGMVLVGTSAGVTAVDAATGTEKWQAAVSGAGAPATSISVSGGCAGTAPEGFGGGTAIAVALGSATVVVTGYDGVHVLELATGKELWKGVPAKAVGTVKNPVLVGGRLYVVDSGGVLALEKS